MNKLNILIAFMIIWVSAYTQNGNSTLSKEHFKILDTTTIKKTFSYEFKKQEVAFSLYNPLPGFNPIQHNPVYYQSFKNTSKLLSVSMKNIKPEPIFPKRECNTFGEALFFGVINALLEKK